MKNLTILFLFIFPQISCQNDSKTKHIENAQLTIENGNTVSQDSLLKSLPKASSGIAEEYIITFAEWQDKSTNVTCLVIREDSLFTIINDGSINGNKNEVIDSGILRIHKKTGKTILTHNPNDIYAPEIGGCSDGPTVVDLKTKIIEFC